MRVLPRGGFPATVDMAVVARRYRTLAEVLEHLCEERVAESGKNTKEAVI